MSLSLTNIEPETTPTSHEPVLREEDPVRFKFQDADDESTHLFHACRHCGTLYLAFAANNFCHVRHKTPAEALEEAHRDNLRWLAKRNLDDA